MSKYCLFLIVIYYLTGGNNSMSRFCKFGKLHVTKGNVDKLLGILLTASKELKRSLDSRGSHRGGGRSRTSGSPGLQDINYQTLRLSLKHTLSASSY